MQTRLTRFALVIQFKGVLAQNLGYLYLAKPDPKLYFVLMSNVLSCALFNMDSTFMIGEWWDGPVRRRTTRFLRGIYVC